MDRRGASVGTRARRARPTGLDESVPSAEPRLTTSGESGAPVFASGTGEGVGHRPAVFSIAAITVIAATLVAGCSGPTSTASASQGASPSPTAAGTPLPSGGITEAKAIELSRSHMSATATFTSASVGTFRDLAPPGTGFDPSDAPDRLVWAVAFAAEVTICSPVGVCDSPRPGVATVYLDFFTGAFVMAGGFSPNPSP